MAVVVLATPPFWLATTRTLACLVIRPIYLSVYSRLDSDCQPLLSQAHSQSFHVEHSQPRKWWRVECPPPCGWISADPALTPSILPPEYTGQAVPNPVVVLDYDPNWPKSFQALRRRIADALGDAAAAIEHVG